MEAQPDDKRALALGKWLAIFEANLEASKTGAQILELQDQNDNTEKIGELLEDIFARKATNTLLRRAGALLQYTEW